MTELHSMPDVTANPIPAPMAGSTMLGELQATLEREIPMSAQMGIRVHEGGLDGLVMWLPLNPNRSQGLLALRRFDHGWSIVVPIFAIDRLARELGASK